MSVVVASILFATLQMFLPPSSSERFVYTYYVALSASKIVFFVHIKPELEESQPLLSSPHK